MTALANKNDVNDPRARATAEIVRWYADHPRGLCAIVGPTASGKSDWAVEVALALGDAVVVSVDSRQIYRGMPIATAQISAAEMRGVPHYGLSIADLHEKWDAKRFAEYAYGVIDAAHAADKRVLLCGGTMLWVDGICGGWSWEDGLPNVPRYPSCLYGIDWPREVLYERINQRAAQMWGPGLLAEARHAHQHAPPAVHNALTTVGLAEARAYDRGLLTEAEAVRKLAQRTRKYAKRQLTWWRARWITPPELVWAQRPNGAPGSVIARLSSATATP